MGKVMLLLQLMMASSQASFLSLVGTVYIIVIEAILVRLCPGQLNVTVLFKAPQHFVLSLSVSIRVCRLCSQQAFSERMDRIWAKQEEKFQLMKNKQGECFGR